MAFNGEELQTLSRHGDCYPFKPKQYQWRTWTVQAWCKRDCQGALSLDREFEGRALNRGCGDKVPTKDCQGQMPLTSEGRALTGIVKGRALDLTQRGRSTK
jgi:hypothetical protein